MRSDYIKVPLQKHTMLDQCIISCSNEGTRKNTIFQSSGLERLVSATVLSMNHKIYLQDQKISVCRLSWRDKPLPDVLIVPLNVLLVRCDFVAWFEAFDDSLYLSLNFQLLENISEEWS